MAKHTTSFTADAALTEIVICKKPRYAEDWKATIQIGGGFGGGTVTLFISLDGGTTKNAMKNLSGTAYSTTTADTIRAALEASGDNTSAEATKLYATVAGSAAPTIKIVVSDNT